MMKMTFDWGMGVMLSPLVRATAVRSKTHFEGDGGNDILIGGAGDGISKSYKLKLEGLGTTQDAITGDADTLICGAGNDWAFGGGGDDGLPLVAVQKISNDSNWRQAA